jgi:hypothetical protein
MCWLLCAFVWPLGGWGFTCHRVVHLELVVVFLHCFVVCKFVVYFTSCSSFLYSFSSAQEMWNYLKCIYNRDNPANRFQLELEITNSKQYNSSVHEYYSGF